jgi:hypothetical protein
MHMINALSGLHGRLGVLDPLSRNLCHPPTASASRIIVELGVVSRAHLHIGYGATLAILATANGTSGGSYEKLPAHANSLCMLQELDAGWVVQIAV